MRRRREQLSQLLDWTSIHFDDGAEVMKISDDALFKVINGQHTTSIRNIGDENGEHHELIPQQGCVPFLFQRWTIMKIRL